MVVLTNTDTIILEISNLRHEEIRFSFPHKKFKAFKSSSIQICNTATEVCIDGNPQPGGD